MGTLGRAQEIVATLEAAGIRATTDPAVLAPPCVLVTPPNLTWDTGCGASLSWSLVALAPAALTADRTSWELLDVLVDDVAAVLDTYTGDLISYSVAGKSYPAYLLKWSEAS